MQEDPVSLVNEMKSTPTTAPTIRNHTYVSSLKSRANSRSVTMFAPVIIFLYNPPPSAARVAKVDVMVM